jgi:hypothetical protein
MSEIEPAASRVTCSSPQVEQILGHRPEGPLGKRSLVFSGFLEKSSRSAEPAEVLRTVLED